MIYSDYILVFLGRFSGFGFLGFFPMDEPIMRRICLFVLNFPNNFPLKHLYLTVPADRTLAKTFHCWTKTTPLHRKKINLS